MARLAAALLIACLQQLCCGAGAVALPRQRLPQRRQRLHGLSEVSRLAVFGTGKWDLDKVFRDEPPGAYLNFLKPLVYAAYLTYPTTHGQRYRKGPWDPPWSDIYHANATFAGDLAGDGQWERLNELEEDPELGGPHSRVLLDRMARRAIVAFRGACMDPGLTQCLDDMCVVNFAKSGTASDICGITMMSMDGYVKHAYTRVRAVKDYLGGDYSVMVTGHSLGGLLALSVGALGGLDFQVVALEPTPFGKVLTQTLGLNATRLAALDASQRYAIYDPTDLRSTSFAPLHVLRPSTTVCVYEGFPLPLACTDCMATHPEMPQGAALDSCLLGPPDPKLLYPKCKNAVHFLDRYAEVFISARDASGAAVLPRCTVVHAPQPAATAP